MQLHGVNRIRIRMSHVRAGHFVEILCSVNPVNNLNTYKYIHLFNHVIIHAHVYVYVCMFKIGASVEIEKKFHIKIRIALWI